MTLTVEKVLGGPMITEREIRVEMLAATVARVAGEPGTRVVQAGELVPMAESDAFRLIRRGRAKPAAAKTPEPPPEKPAPRKRGRPKKTA